MRAREVCSAWKAILGDGGADERRASDAPAAETDTGFASAVKAPSMPSERGSDVIPVNESSFQDQAQALQAKFDNFDIRFGDEDQDEAVHSSFAQIDNDIMGQLTDRNPLSENHNILEASLQRFEEASGIEMNQGVPPEDFIV